MVGDIHIELLPLYNEVLPGLVHFERFLILTSGKLGDVNFCVYDVTEKPVNPTIEVGRLNKRGAATYEESSK